MSTPFAAIEANLNAGVLAKLANKTATWQSQQIDGVFDNGYSEPQAGFAGFESREPSFTCLESLVVGVAHGQLIVIGGVNYKVANIAPDGTGVVQIMLKK